MDASIGSPSEFQRRFPLSPKKFWREFAGTLIGSIFLIIFLFVFTWLGEQFSPSLSASASAGTIGWGICAFLCLIVIIHLAWRAWYVGAYIHHYRYDAADDFAIFKEGVFSQVETQIQYQKIQDVYIDRDLVDRFFGLYNVHIASAATTSNIDGVDEATADGLKAYFLQMIVEGTASARDESVANATSTAATDATAQADQMKAISSDQFPISMGFVWVQLPGMIRIALYLGLVVGVSAGFAIGHDWQWPLACFIIVFTFMMLLAITITNTARKNMRFALLPEYIQYSQKIITNKEVHVLYRTIQDVSVVQGFMDKQFGLASVVVQNNAGQNGNLILYGQAPENARIIAEAIRLRIPKDTSETGL